MATSSLALQRAGLIDPTKPATYPVVLGEDILRNGEPGSGGGKTFTGIRYNFKPRHLIDNNTQRKSTLTKSDSEGEFDVTFRDNSGGRYVYAGTRVSKGSKYVLVFDSKMRRFILHRLDSLFIMNMVDTPTNHDTAGLKKRHPYINETTKRPRPPRGANQLVRRPLIKKSSSGSTGPMRPIPKPLVRASPKPVTVLRSSQDIKKKERRAALNFASDSVHDSDRETKAAKDVREQREAIVVKTARDNRDSGATSPRDLSITVSPRGAREAALFQRSKANALSSRPREASKLSMETKASPDSKDKERDNYRDKDKDKNGKGSTPAKDGSKYLKVPDAKARLPEKPRLPDKSEKVVGKTDKSSLLSDKPRLPEKPAMRTGKDASSKDRKDAKATTPTREGKSITARPLLKSSSNDNTNNGKTKSKGVSLPLPLPIPAPAPVPATAPAPASADKKKKKKTGWEEEDDEDDDDDGDIGLVIEYPGGPPPARNRQALGSSGASGGGSGASKQLHMPTFDEFQRAGDSECMDGDADDDGDMEGYWDPREDEKKAEAEVKVAPAPAPAPALDPPAKAAPKAGPKPSKAAPKPTAKGASKPASAKSSVPKSAAIAIDEDSDEDDMANDLEAELEDELEAELNKELQEEEARKKQEADALLEAELEAAFMAEEQEESEISEEE
ncbi:hypothetical protein SCUCBS95973_009183 [Sporothrix curviconia]|uniref:Transcription elongation factor Eaf N-terminal domain-containing protein n=1 Tax=Sporothrix curviconia TaxID=1260050 RepID=A0ABP0CVH2_9PEZI